MTGGRGWVALAALVAASAPGCKTERATTTSAAAGAPAPVLIRAAPTDSLWALAPPDATSAIVVAAGALAPLHAGLVTVVGALERSRATSPLAQRLRAELSATGLSALDRARLARLGFDLTRGAALFVSPTGPVLILPVADRKRFVAELGGASKGGLDLVSALVCREVSGHYACAGDASQLDRLGKGRNPLADWPPELRGHVEAEISAAAQTETLHDLGLEGANRVRIGARLERGGGTVRAHWAGSPAGILADARVHGSSPLARRLADRSPTGVFVLDAARLWRHLEPRIQRRLPRPELPGGVTLAELVGSLDGRAEGWALGGDAGAVRVDLSAEGPVRRLLGSCAALERDLVVPGVKISTRGERCAIALDPAVIDPGGPLTELLSVELWVERGALVIGFGGAARPSGHAALPTFAREVLGRPHFFAAWGHGSLIGSQDTAGTADRASAPGDDMAAAIAFWVQHLTELGIWVDVRDDGLHAAVRVRTLWSNPDPVVAEAERLIDDLAAGRPGAAAKVAELPRRFPGTPLAHDTAAGSAGLILPTLAVGMLSGTLGYAARPHSSDAVAAAPDDDAQPPVGPDPPSVVRQTELEALRVSGERGIQPPKEDAVDMARTQRGTVGVLKMCLGPDGHVSRLYILKSTGYPAYDAKLKRGVQKWIYRPFMVNGKPVPVCTAVTFIYRPRPPSRPKPDAAPGERP